ncbi:hypothetical protein A2619_05660 [candidate division WWE3 bacterium RIFOXYD1_FULL_39_9]|uniref:Uncharacterized protein n=1 Tax=candidate division WWE3 bacterium RIFOXYD1_FULL_39_9 TaxID=1802649 RepID=A0A1F4X991_UNCKA|nr:MAG: hypothetical protein A2619_05660 [candidate division WWE3 bacterium RIFOXYD1_FULL_39_9]
MLKKVSTPFLGFLQTTGVVIYLILLTAFFNFVTPLLNNGNEEIYAPIIMLLLFIISAVITASTFLGRAGVLFWERKYKEAFTLIGWSVGWGLVYFTILIIGLILL